MVVTANTTKYTIENDLTKKEKIIIFRIIFRPQWPLPIALIVWGQWLP